jgi:predicted small lipoprotein YifL
MRRNTSEERGARRALGASAVVACSVVSSLSLAGCGAKTGLEVPPGRDAGLDARTVPDGGSDAGRDAGLDARILVPPDVFVAPDVVTPRLPADVCIEVPPEEPTEEVTITYRVGLDTADVLFLVDVTGSMGEEIEQIRSNVRDVLIPNIAAQIADVRFAVAHYADFPVEPYGAPGTDEVFRLVSPVTADPMAVQAAVDRLSLQMGNDGPESTTEALYLTATGEGLGDFAWPRSCEDPSSRGYPCFRPRAAPVILLFTDAQFHNGPFGANLYDGISPRPHRYGDAVGALRAIGARVVGLSSGSFDPVALAHLRAIARDTGTVRADGSPLVFDIGIDGRRLDTSVIDAIRSLVSEVPTAIEAELVDDPTDALDATTLVSRVEAASVVPPDGARIVGDAFADVLPGSEVTFVVHFDNRSVTRTDRAQVYRLVVVLRGDGMRWLRDFAIDVVIPSRGGEGCASIEP